MILLIATLLQAPAAKSADTIVEPDWDIRPTVQMIEKYYPPAALEASKSGRVVLHCQLPPTGIPDHCRVTDEVPKGLGFGDAALAMAAELRFRPRMVNGVAANGEVSIPITFEKGEYDHNADVPPLKLVEQCVGAYGSVLERRPQALGFWHVLAYWNQMMAAHAGQNNWRPSEVEARSVAARARASKQPQKELDRQGEECDARFRQFLASVSLDSRFR